MSTISDYSTALFAFFRENDTFDPQKNFAQVAPPVFVDEALERATALAAAKAFQKQKLVRRVKVGSGFVFVLTKSFSRYSQTVEVSGEVAGMVAKVLNDFKAQSGWYEFAADPLNITNDDVYHVMLLARKAVDTADGWLAQIT